MHNIKTKETVRDIKALDRGAVAAEHIKKAAVRARDTARNLMDDGQVTPEEYAGDQLRYAARNAASGAGQKMKRNAGDAKRRIGNRKSSEGSRAGASFGQHVPRRRDSGKDPVIQRDGTGSTRLRRRQQGVRAAGREGRAPANLSGGPVRSGSGAGQTIKTAQNAGKISVKTSGYSLHNTNRAVEARRRQAKAAAGVTKKAAASAVRAGVAVKEAVSRAAKAIAGGSTAAVIVVVLCLVGLIAGSCFGIFFSGETEGETGISLRSAVREINEEYQGKLDAIKAENPHDKVEMTGPRAVWPEVLSVYAVSVAGHPQASQEVATMTQEKKQTLTDIFWQMNEISSRSEKASERVVTEKDDGKGNIVKEEKTQEVTTLYIDVSHRTAKEMADVLGFTAHQKLQLRELLDADRSMWTAVLYGVYGSDDMIAQIALSQVGCAGGETFWSWYGFGSRVEWCACFVSWCADQCGYIESEVVPKFAGCPSGVEWFRNRQQWADNSIEPSPGMIIFFDWDNLGDSGPQDGEADHTGIVVRVENGTVYTVEGNCNETCQALQYPVGHYQILGYGILAY